MVFLTLLFITSHLQQRSPRFLRRFRKMAKQSAWTDEDVREAQIPDPEWPICWYHRGTRLGTGGYARVYKVLNVRTGGVFAGKTSPRHVKHLRREARILRNLDHPKIVKYVEYFEERERPAANVLVMELCAGGSLQTTLNDYSRGLTRKATLEVLYQVAQAVEYLHGKNRFHGDLKPRNILIRSWDPIDVVVADCAEVMRVDHINAHKKPHGTHAYWSPYI
ncbi:serine/threonine protein kinase [Fusarium austroafricanum]|uniref:Serine/threonine protein kinase n=1 Tax=Fusarium austroafricanum TaxID=2364996 RepID=A0A8H4KK73_9HYPO|nr:serine/threonine protein kinase [Fusarium austroafricanum]